MKVTIIGNGQQGGSLARALGKNPNYDVHCYDHDADARSQLISLFLEDDIIARLHTKPDSAVDGADIIILATPIDQFAPVIGQISPHLTSDTIVMDIGSGKVKSIEEITEALPEGVKYIPTHPIAGAAKSGPNASRPDMYNGETVVVVPQDDPDLKSAQEAVEDLWRKTGATIAHMDASTHDSLYGTISHFEHVVAFALTASGYDEDQGSTEDHQKAGDTMRAITRIAGGPSPDMWIPIFRDNNAAVMLASDGFKAQLQALKTALKSDSPAELQALLEPAHAFRKEIKSDRQRESIHGEIADIATEYGYGINRLVCAFNTAAKTALVKRSLLPTLVGAAITLNAMDIEQNHLTGVKIADVANPSFKDGSAPMLNHPEHTAQLLFDNRAELLETLQTFEREFDHFSQQVRDNNEQGIRDYIAHVTAIRQTMPACEEPRQAYIHS